MDGVIVGVLAQKDWFALLNVNVAGTGPCWFDAEGDKLACLLSCLGSQSQRFLESFLVGNDVIGWGDEHGACMMGGPDPASPTGRRSGCVAFCRLSDDGLCWD